jgi:hypothetical protein
MRCGNRASLLFAIDGQVDLHRSITSFFSSPVAELGRAGALWLVADSCGGAGTCVFE